MCPSGERQGTVPLMQEAQITIFTDDAHLFARLSRALVLWQESLCLRCRVARGGMAKADDAGDARALWLLDMALAPERLPAPDDKRVVVALAGDDRQALRAYRWHPAALLSPDFDWNDLCRALERCFDAWQLALSVLPPGCGGLPLCLLAYVEAAGRKSLLHTRADTLLVPVPFGALVEQLSAPPFFRCQRSYLVNLAGVEAIRGGKLLLRGGAELPVSRAAVEPLRRALDAWRQEREAL